MKLKKRIKEFPQPPKDDCFSKVADLVILFKGHDVMTAEFRTGKVPRTPKELGLEVAITSKVGDVTVVEFKNSRKVQFYGPSGNDVYQVMLQYREDHKSV